MTGISKKWKQNIFTKTLQRQILIPFLSLIIIGGLALALISYSFSVSLTTDELVDNIEGQMKSLNESFSLYFSMEESLIDYYSKKSEIKNYQSYTNELIRLFNDMVESNESIKHAYLGTKFGDMITNQMFNVPEDYNPKETQWYQLAVENPDSVVWTDPYIDIDTNDKIISVAKAVRNSGQIKGVFSIDIDMSSILAMVEDIKIGESGYGAIIDAKGTYISHPNEEFIGKDISNESYFQKISEQESEVGVVNYNDQGKEMAMGYAINKETGWIIIGTIDKAEIAERARPIMVPISIALLAIVVLSIFISLIVTRRIVKPIRLLKDKTREVESGNLSIDIETDRHDEIGQLSDSINQMKESLRHLIQNVSNAVDSVSTQSDELTQSANKVREGSEQIASTMQQLSSGAESQASTSSDLSETMGQFVEKINQTQQNGGEIEKTSQRVLSMTEEGSSLMSQSIDQMNTIVEIVKAAVNKVQGLDEQSKEVSNLVRVIRDISEQTNLLALNAAIEAARAGEAGKGFAVVADEVRKLAEKVSESVVDITSIVTNIQTESSSVVESLQSGYEEVEKGTKQIKVTGQTFNEIDQSMTDMVSKIKNTSSYLMEIADSGINMNEAIENIASISQESAAGIEQTAAAAQESNTSMEKVATSSKELSQLAELLHQHLSKFKL